MFNGNIGSAPESGAACIQLHLQPVGEGRAELCSQFAKFWSQKPAENGNLRRFIRAFGICGLRRI